MQKPAKLRSIRKLKDTSGATCRQVFNFGDDSHDQLVVEISFHKGMNSWTAEAYYYGTDFYECHWAQVFSTKRKELIRRLRMSVAVKRDPKIQEVNDMMFGGRQMGKAMKQAEKLARLGVDYAAGPETIVKGLASAGLDFKYEEVEKRVAAYVAASGKTLSMPPVVVVGGKIVKAEIDGNTVTIAEEGFEQ